MLKRSIDEQLMCTYRCIFIFLLIYPLFFLLQSFTRTTFPFLVLFYSRHFLCFFSHTTSLLCAVIFWEFSQGRGFITVKDAETIFHSILNAQGKQFVADAFSAKLTSVINKTPEGGRLSLDDLKLLYLAQSLFV